MKVSTISTIVVFFLALLGSIGATSYYYTQCNNAVKTEVHAHLESVAQSRAHHIEDFLNDNKILARELSLIGEVKGALLNPSESNILAVNQRLQKTIDAIDEIIKINIVNKSGIIIAGTDANSLGIDKTNDNRWEKLNNGEIGISEVKFPIEGGNPVLSIASPVNGGNGIIGFVFIRLDIEKSLFPLLLDKTGIGETGETYLVNKEGYAISPLLFVEDAVLKWKIDSVNSRNCFSHEHEKEIRWEEHEEIQEFLNYRGEKVLGVHAYIPETQWCLLAEINEEEILGNQRAVFQKTALTIIITLVIVVTLIGFFIGKFIDKRVVLKKGRKEL